MNGSSIAKSANDGCLNFPKLIHLVGIFTLTPLALFFSAFASAADSVEFNDSFLRSPVNVRSFEKGNPVSAGVHRVDIYLNDQWIGREDINFALPVAAATIAQPCYTLKLMDLLGFDLDKIDKDIQAKLASAEQCLPLGQLAPGTQASYDSGSQQLNISAPQIILKRNARGYVNPALWDKGITAAMLQYNYNAYHSEQSGVSSQTSQYLGLRGGFNWDVWRLRYRATANWGNGQGSSYRGSELYAERALVNWRSKLILGQSSTDGQVFDSIGYMGAQVASDDRMYTDSQRGFAPVIRGVANTTALVRVSQRGNQIYETTVPPGPFQIDDLYPSGVGGDLLVTIKEANGNERSFTVVYSSTPELLRPGVTRYSVAAGSYHNTAVSSAPALLVGTVRRGFSNIVTGYSGVIGSNYYQSVSAGLALNTGIGAISSDITQSRSQLSNNESTQGQSIRLTYAKILPVIDTNITLASYQYSSSGYYGMDEAMSIRERYQNNIYSNYYYTTINRRNRFQINASQALPEGWGSVSVNANMQNYWNRSGTDTEYQMAYNNYYKRVNYGVNVGRTRDLVTNSWDNKVMFSVSIPLGSSDKAPYLTTSYTQEKDHQGIQNSVAGSAGEDRQYGYNVFANGDRNSGDQSQTTATGGGSASWSAPYATLGSSFSTSRNYQQYGADISGGIVAYSGGVVLTPLLGDTTAIVEAKNAQGARVTNYNGLRLDKWGRAVVPYLTPYRQNGVEIDPKGISHDIELKATSQNVAPTAGAVTLLRYETTEGYSVLINTKDARGLPLPFGATVFDAAHRDVGYIAQAGQGLLRVKQQQGVLTVQWGDGAGASCTFNYKLPPFTAKTAADFRRLDAICK